MSDAKNTVLAHAERICREACDPKGVRYQHVVAVEWVTESLLAHIDSLRSRLAEAQRAVEVADYVATICKRAVMGISNMDAFTFGDAVQVARKAEALVRAKEARAPAPAAAPEPVGERAERCPDCGHCGHQAGECQEIRPSSSHGVSTERCLCGSDEDVDGWNAKERAERVVYVNSATADTAIRDTRRDCAALNRATVDELRRPGQSIYRVRIIAERATPADTAKGEPRK